MKFPVPGGVRTARPVACLVIIVLCVGLAACSGSSKPSGSLQASASAQPPVPPDPCELLTNAEVQLAYGSDPRAASLNWAAMTRKSNYDASLDDDGIFDLTCVWNIATVDEGGVPFTVMELSLNPVAKYIGDACASPITGVGQAACASESSGLDVKAGAFDLDVFDAVAVPADLAVEQQLAAKALAALQSDTHAA